jgi:hypothetical protein
MKLANMGGIFLPIGFALSVVFAATSAPVKVFILSGQSNMVGFGKTSEITASDQIAAEYPNIKYFVATDEVYVIKPFPKLIYSDIHQQSRDFKIPTFGPEIGLAAKLSALYPNEKIILVKVAWGGTSLAGHWIRDDGGIYTWFKARVQEAITMISNDDPTNNFSICGIFWMQGEADACDALMAPVYAKNLLYFVDSMLRPFLTSVSTINGVPHVTLTNGKIPFIYGEIHYGWPNYGGVLLQQQWQAQFKVPCTRCMEESKRAQRWNELPPPSNLKEIDDGFSGAHYTTKGILVVGRAFGDAWIKFTNKVTTPGCRSEIINSDLMEILE